ncbi:MAG: SdpI family protein, partial [Spirochaetaceae bacterium]|nr:SdpI family protein [Spirochaetaceae bacterium]
KKMNKKTVNIITIVLMVLTLIGISIAYRGLPDTIPTHWGMNGKIDSYGSKNTLYFLYLILIGINALFIVIPKIDPKKENFKKFDRAFSIFRLVFNIFFIAIITIMIMSASGNSVLDTTSSILFLVGLLLAIIGNYLPKFKYNYSAGIRTPWTLANENVWAKTHRMAGPLWVIGGIISAISALILPNNTKTIVFVIIVLIISLIPIIYSYLEFQKEQKS